MGQRRLLRRPCGTMTAMNEAPTYADLQPWLASGERVLVIEDEARLARLIGEALQRAGYRVDTVHDGPGGLRLGLAGGHDAIVLDLMLPGMSGYEVLKKLRGSGATTPVLILTAKDGEYDQLDALELGADDYLTKPFSTLILLARVATMIRRRPTAPVQWSGRVRLEPLRRRAWCDDVELGLTAREFDVLAYLVARPDEVVPKQALLEDVWLEPYATPNLVEVCVAGLRRKLGAGVIETVRNAGYRVATGPA